MTAEEREHAEVIDGSRRKRIAKGSGTSVEDVNRLLKQYAEMRKMLKMVGQMTGEAVPEAPKKRKKKGPFSLMQLAGRPAALERGHYHMLVIRMRRTGSKKRPHYRVVVTERRSPREGGFIETLGFYNPRTKPAVVDVNKERDRPLDLAGRAAVGFGAHAAGPARHARSQRGGAGRRGRGRRAAGVGGAGRGWS